MSLRETKHENLGVEFITPSTMQLHTGAEHCGNVIFRYSELISQYHFDASIDVNRI
jgi:hypothetical protein